jgi:hypothetical protein
VYPNVEFYDTRWKMDNLSSIVTTHYDTNIVQRFIYFYAKIIASCSVSAKISDSEENLNSKVELGAQSAIDTLILVKSKERYEIVYKYFEEWMDGQENS